MRDSAAAYVSRKMRRTLSMKTVAFALLTSIAFVAPNGAQLPPLTSIPTGTHVVVGRISDITTDVPLPGAVVTLTGFFDAAGHPADRLPESIESRLASAPHSVIATADGSFVFRDLPVGRYAVAASAFGYAPNMDSPRFAEVTNSDKPVSVSIRLSKYGSISGTVVDERGEPVVGVPVTALHRRIVGGGLALRYDGAGVETDDRGVYRIPQLRPGEYVIAVLSTTTSLPADVAGELGSVVTFGPAVRTMVQAGIFPTTGDGIRVGNRVLLQMGPAAPLAPDGRMLIYQNTFAPAVSNSAEATVVTLGSGESRAGVDVTIRFSPAVAVSGAATGPDGPIANLAVRLIPAGAERIDAYTADANPAGVTTAMTDPSGTFIFPAVPPGQYALTAAVAIRETSDTAGVSLWGTQPLAVADKDIRGISIALQPGIRVRGRVEFTDASSARPGETPALDILLIPVAASGIWRTNFGHVAAGETSFVTGGDPPGRYMVSLRGQPEWMLARVARGTRPLPEDILELEDEEIRDIAITLTRNATRISGSIVDAMGAPDSDTRVVIFPADTTFWREGIFNPRRVRRMAATSSGTFEFNGMAPGDYYIAAVNARVPDAWDDPVLYERLISGASKVTVDAGASVTVALKSFMPRGQ